MIVQCSLGCTQLVMFLVVVEVHKVNDGNIVEIVFFNNVSIQDVDSCNCGCSVLSCRSNRLRN